MASVVSLRVTSNVSSFGAERRFKADSTIHSLKGNLELITGATSQFMTLEVYDKDDNLFVKIDDDDKTLESYNVEDGMRIHVIDKNPNRKAGEFEDLSKVEKFELASEEYDKKTDSVRHFLKQQKLGKYSADAKDAVERAKLKELEEEAKSKSMRTGERCEVTVLKQPVKRGTVMYIGLVNFKPGVWVGVKYDEPVGKNDGSVQGKRYFDCPQKYGGFIRPSQVTIGDFPEETFEDDEI